MTCCEYFIDNQVREMFSSRREEDPERRTDREGASLMPTAKGANQKA
jgi:hypothetical protein